LRNPEAGGSGFLWPSGRIGLSGSSSYLLSLGCKRVAWLAEEFKRKPLEKAARQLALRLKVFSLRELGINTHSLRYTFITHLASQGVSPQLIAKITGHSRLDYVLHYTQRLKAEELLERLVLGGAENSQL